MRIAMQEKISEFSQNSVRIAGMMLLIGFAMVFVIVGINLSKTGLNLKRDLTQAAALGYDQIAQGVALVHAKDFEHAITLFQTARQTFSSIQNNTWFASGSLGSSAVEDPLFTAGNAVIEGGKYLATAGSLFAQSAKNMGSIPKNFFEANRNEYNPATHPSLTATLKKELPLIEQSVKELANANSAIQKIPETFVPEDVREKFRFARDALATSTKLLTDILSQMPAILTLLADEKPHKFLVLLQNNDELRPTGGFIGNFMILETQNGYISKMEVKDVYSADHQLKEPPSPPPEIEFVNTKWYLRDSNYSMHFPASAEKALWFLDQEINIKADTVIAIDATFIQDLLDITGPVKIPSLSRPIRSTNFNQIISYIVESKLAGREDPKAILREFMPEFEKSLFKNVDPISLLPFLSSAIQKKHLLAYSTNKDIQEFFRANSLTGEIKITPNQEDYLAVAHSNIGGNKSDPYILETIQHDTYLNADGTIENTVTITRKNTWSSETEKNIRAIIQSFGFKDISNGVWEILGRSRNLHMLRIYVPKDAKLLAGSDSETKTIYDPDTQKTYFSTKMEVPVGQSRTVKIRYLLPFKLHLSPAAKYTLNIQKQPGQKNITFVKKILPESGVLNYAYSPADGVFDPDGVWRIEIPFDSDRTFVSAWGK